MLATFGPFLRATRRARRLRRTAARRPPAANLVSHACAPEARHPQPQCAAVESQVQQRGVIHKSAPTIRRDWSRIAVANTAALLRAVAVTRTFAEVLHDPLARIVQ